MPTDDDMDVRRAPKPYDRLGILTNEERVDVLFAAMRQHFKNGRKIHKDGCQFCGGNQPLFADVPVGEIRLPDPLMPPQPTSQPTSGTRCRWCGRTNVVLSHTVTHSPRGSSVSPGEGVCPSCQPLMPGYTLVPIVPATEQLRCGFADHDDRPATHRITADTRRGQAGGSRVGRGACRTCASHITTGFLTRANGNYAVEPLCAGFDPNEECGPYLLEPVRGGYPQPLRCNRHYVFCNRTEQEYLHRANNGLCFECGQPGTRLVRLRAEWDRTARPSRIMQGLLCCGVDHPRSARYELVALDPNALAVATNGVVWNGQSCGCSGNRPVAYVVSAPHQFGPQVGRGWCERCVDFITTRMNQRSSEWYQAVLAPIGN